MTVTFRRAVATSFLSEWSEFMTKMFVRLALCAGLVVCGGFLRAEGTTAAPSEPTVKTTKTEKGRESKIHVFLPTEEAKLYFDSTLTKATGKDRAFRSPALEEGKR